MIVAFDRFLAAHPGLFWLACLELGAIVGLLAAR
jgi:hypothetical protein